MQESVGGTYVGGRCRVSEVLMLLEAPLLRHYNKLLS
jgi:hypothetical protein